MWSPDGRALAVSGGNINGPLSYSSLVYPDGSCLDCQTFTFFDASEPSFTHNATLFTAVVQSSEESRGLWEFGVDGLQRKLLIQGAVSDPAWSSRGDVAVARGAWIWAGRPDQLRRVTRGTTPAWSPDGAQIVFGRRGWLLIGRVGAHSFRRLVRGAAPAWSPDGSWIAFFGKGHRLSVVRATGGRIRHVGKLTGSAVDWQPLPATPPVPCLSPSGYKVIASSSTAIVSEGEVVGAGRDHGSNFPVMGCVRADGRERLLGIGAAHVDEAAAAGTYAAVSYHVPGGSYKAELFPGQTFVDLYDLQTSCWLNTPYCGSSAPHRVRESLDCPYPGTCVIDQLVLGSDADSAVHATLEGADTSGNICSCTSEEIQASDSTGLHTLDTITEPDGSPAALTNLRLTGDTLTWDHNGTPRSAELQP